MAATPIRTSSAPPKPWERAGAVADNNGPSPFAAPSTATSTAAAVASGSTTGDQQKDENYSVAEGTAAGRPPSRPWEVNRAGYGTGAVSAYGQTGYGAAPYGAGGGLYGGGNYAGYGGLTRPGGMYGGYGGGNMYGNGGYGGGMYGNRYGGGGYGGALGGYGGMAGGYGMGPGGNPNYPGGEPPPQAPGFWQSLLQSLTGVMNFFGRLSMLVDENTQALHFFITALLQLFDRSGVLYGELARFVLRILRYRSKAKARVRFEASAGAVEEAKQNGRIQGPQPAQNLPGRPAAPELAWDNVWKDENARPS